MPIRRLFGMIIRFGMKVVLPYREGYELMPEMAADADGQAAGPGGSFDTIGSLEEAFEGVDIIYPKS